MEKSKVQLIIGALLLISFPLVCWLDNPNSTPIMPQKGNNEVEKENELEKEEREQQAKRDQEREEREQKQKRENEKQERYSKRIEMANTLETILSPEWSDRIDVDVNGNFELTHELENGEWEQYTFNITGITFEKKEMDIYLNGAIKREHNDKVQNASNLIISRNAVILDLLQKFQTAVMEDLVK